MYFSFGGQNDPQSSELTRIFLYHENRLTPRIILSPFPENPFPVTTLCPGCPKTQLFTRVLNRFLLLLWPPPNPGSKGRLWLFGVKIHQNLPKNAKKRQKLGFKPPKNAWKRCPINFLSLLWPPKPGGEMANCDLFGVKIAKNSQKTPKIRFETIQKWCPIGRALFSECCSTLKHI